LTPQARFELLKLDKQTFIEHMRKNFYCSRCNGLLLECFTQIVAYGKPLQLEAPESDRLSTAVDSRAQQEEQDEPKDPWGYPWGGLSATKDGTLTLLDCFAKAKSLHVLQNVSVTCWNLKFFALCLVSMGNYKINLHLCTCVY
jgi:hypothetical protein